jgi:uncharacterized membrane protein
MRVLACLDRIHALKPKNTEHDPPMLKRFNQRLIGALFILAGINHFVRRDIYLAIMPPYLPWHRALVDLSGYAEIGLGALLLVPRYVRVAGLGLIALLVAVFPANLHMALHPQRFRRIPRAALWLRLPLQAVLIAWVEWSTRPPRS